jgi:hypothetical protein
MMRREVFLATALGLGLGVSGLGAGCALGSSASCQDECSPAHAARCDGTRVQACEVSSTGCLAWVTRSECADTGQACDPATLTCSGECVDLCAAAGQTQCSDTVIQSCTANAAGCLVWSNADDCASQGKTCTTAGGAASCTGGGSCPNPPGAPAGPTPADGATGVAAATTSVDWADATGATSYAVYLSTSCPPPAYPGAGFTTVTASTRTGLALVAGASYCWQVIAIDGAGCTTAGPVWDFQTGGTCSDPVAGAPTVTSTDASYPIGTTSDTYALRFSEPVHDVAASLVWTPLTGSGTMQVTPVDATTYTVAFAGVADGDRYRLTIGTGVTDDCGHPLAAAVNRIITIAAPAPPGSTCADAVDVTGATFPYQLTGTFDDDPATGGTCDTTPTNAVWFKYTPTAAGTYTISVENDTTTNAYSRLAMFSGTSCSPLGTELGCLTQSGTSLVAEASLAAGTTYLILFHTDGDGFTMVNPSLTITKQTTGAGEFCSTAADVSGVTFPYQLAGTFSQDPASGGSCDSSPTNAVWFSYTPAATGYYTVAATNHTGTTAYAVLAVFAGAACSPLGTQLACVTASGKTASTTVALTAGTTYLVLFHTDGNSYTMVDPSISITAQTGGAGEFCATPADVSSATFPYSLTGTFNDDPTPGTSCVTAPANAVWFKYTPATTGYYGLSATNHTTTNAYSRMAVFQGAGCSPYGAELTCFSASSKTAATELYLAGGSPYLILFHTDGLSYTMVNPEITITHPSYAAGERCGTAADVTGQTFPHTLTGTFTDDPATGGTCDSSPTNAVWFTYTPATTRSYTIQVENQTTTTAFSRLAVFQTAACAPYGTQLACVTASSKTASTTQPLTQGVTYLILFHTDGPTYTMVNPILTIS